MSAAEFEKEVNDTGKKIGEIIEELKDRHLSSIGERQMKKRKSD